MSDEVRNAASIGAAVNRSLANLPGGGKKSKKKVKKTTETNETSSTKSSENSAKETQKPEKGRAVEFDFKEIRDLFRLKPGSPAAPTQTSPASRTRKPAGKNATIKDVKTALGAGKIDQEQAVNLSSGYARDFAKKEVGRQFKDYAGSYGTDREPPVNLTNLNTKKSSGNELDEVTGPTNPNGRPTGKFVNPTGPIF